MACMKVSSLKEELPRSFSSMLQMKNTIGVMKPSLTAPIKPNTINIQSTPSASINIDPMLPQLFIFIFFLYLSSQFLFQRKDQNDYLTLGKGQLAVFSPLILKTKAYLLFFFCCRFSRDMLFVHVFHIILSSI